MDPVPILRVPYFNVPVFAADGKAQGLAVEGGASGVGEGDRVDGGGGVGDGAEAVDVHCGLGVCRSERRYGLE